MASDRQLEEGITDDYGSELNTSPTAVLAPVSALARCPEESMLIQTLRPFIESLIRQNVTEQIELAKQELLANIKETCLINPAKEATTSVPKRLKLQFRNKISLPVFTGKRLSGENQTTIEIALVDAFTDQIIDTGIESTAKVEIVGFRVGDDGRIDDSWTFEDFQESILSEKKGKHRILQGDTCLQLKAGVCSVSKISFTHTAKNIKNGWYRLGAGVVDAALMNRVEVASTEAFLMKDGRTIFSEKRPYPRLSDRVCHLRQIGRKGRTRRLKDAGVTTVKDLLTLLYTDKKQLQDILQVKDSSDTWHEIVNNAQASSGMFLCLDSSNQGKTGVVLDGKRQLKGLIAEHNQYIPVDKLSAKQKADNEELLKFASERFKTLKSFEDEACLKEYLISTSFSSLPFSNINLETSNTIDESETPSSYTSNSLTETQANFNNSNSHINECMTRAPIVTSFDNEMTDLMNYNHMPPHHAYNYPTDLGTSSEPVESPINTCSQMNNTDSFDQCLMDYLFNNIYFNEELGHIPNHESIIHFDNKCHSEPITTVCTIVHARTRWTKVSKLLRNMISFQDGIRALKRQRCC